MAPENIHLHSCYTRLSVIIAFLRDAGVKPSEEDMAWVKELFSINYHLDSEDSGKVIFFLFDQYMHEKSDHLTDQLLYLLQLDSKMQNNEELTEADWSFILDALNKWATEVFRQLAAK
jgi:hypothetical protein